MKSKTLTLLSFSVLALVLVMSFMSATDCLNLTEISVPTEINQDDGTLTVSFELSNRGTCTADKDLFWSVTSDKDNYGTWDNSSLPDTINMAALDTTPIKYSLTFTFDDTIPLGEMDITIHVDDGETSIDEFDLALTPITILESEDFAFCQYDNDDNNGNPNTNLKIDIDKVDNTGEFGDNNEWYPGSEIEITIKVENNGREEKIKDIKVEWGLYDSDSGEWVIEIDDLDDFNLKEKKYEILTFDFTIKDSDFDIDLEDISNEDLLLYVRATGYDEEYEETICESDFEEIQLMLGEDFIILEDIQILPETAQCGSTIQVTAEVWNIGDSDQDDVFILVYNNKEGINEMVEIDGGVDAFNKEDLNLFITLPSDLEEKAYVLYFTVYDDEDMSSSDIFKNSDDDQAKFETTFEVSGNCVSNEPQALITMDSENAIQSGGEAGEELVVKIKVTNTGSKLLTYDLSASEYSDWADSAEFDSDTLAIGAGDYAYALVTLNVNEDISGEQAFDFKVSTDGTLLATQPVEVTITDSGFKFPSITGSVISGDNWYLWGIGALNVILVIIIIIVAIRVAKN